MRKGGTGPFSTLCPSLFHRLPPLQLLVTVYHAANIRHTERWHIPRRHHERCDTLHQHVLWRSRDWRSPWRQPAPATTAAQPLPRCSGTSPGGDGKGQGHSITPGPAPPGSPGPRFAQRGAPPHYNAGSRQEGSSLLDLLMAS